MEYDEIINELPEESGDDDLRERYELAAERLATIRDETAVPEPFRDYFVRCAAFLELALKGREAANRALYEDILPDNYAKSYGNPVYAAEKLGDAMGPLLSAVYAEIRGIIPAVFEDDLKDTTILMELFLQVYAAFTDDELPSENVVKDIFRWYLIDYLPDRTEERLDAMLDPTRQFAREIIESADLNDLSYLESFGEYVTDETRRTAAYLNTLPEEDVTSIARTFTEGYRTGFIKAGKPLAKKKTVEILYELGFERIVREAIRQFREIGLETVIPRSAAALTNKRQAIRNGYYGAIPNRQFDYDHRNDIALVLDRDYISKRLRDLQNAYEERRELADVFGGPAALETFGEVPFEPESNAKALTLSETQQKLSVEMDGERIRITNRYIKGEESSYTIMALPVSEIGEPYDEIFKETVRLNTLPADEYEAIQQKLIDALDQGTTVRVKGCGDNQTDLTVALRELRNPDKETNFENCVADVNIPVGEVFTSPKLEGTNGLLHVSHVYLEGLCYRDLKIRVKDGMVTDYSCDNYEDAAEGRVLIEENILFRHKTLPVGEFAIGTNTTAYMAGRKYAIEGKLPILIAEKTGPHFAFGDTCYSYEEDVPVFNPDGKEIVARENALSALRKSDPSKAYFSCHTDITIPFDELGSITVCSEKGDIPLIRNGRFVLPGTEALNAPLE